MKRALNIQIIRYLAIGGTAAVVNLGIFFVFAKLLGLNYMIVGAVAFAIATLVNYELSVRHVFESGIRFEKKQEIFWIYVVSLVGMGIDLVTLYICISIFQVEMMMSKVVATGVVFFWNYYARKHFVFKAKKNSSDSTATV
jgi:putative flippase GtrA